MVLIFDMDGVIVDNHSWHLKAFQEFGRRHGLNITNEAFGKHFGSTNHVIMKSLFGDHITEQEITAFANEKEEIYREIYKPTIKAVAGLEFFLQFAYRTGIPVALATSAPTENVTFTLKETGLEKYFGIITDSSMVKHGKPDPEIYLQTASKLGVQPSECIVFEDSIPGIVSAQKAGMEVIGVATTHNYRELITYVNEIIMNFEAADQLILNRLKSK